MPRHLHIVQTLDVRRSGGLALVGRLHEAMLQSGIASTLVYNRADEAAAAGVKCVVRLNPILGNRFYFGMGSCGKIAAAAAASDVIHVHGLYTYMNYAAGKISRVMRIPVIYHPHGALAPTYLRRGRIKKWLTMVAFERRNLGRLAGWRALTAIEAEQIRAVDPAGRVVIVANGVALPEVPTWGKRRGEGRRTFLFLSRLAITKGVDLLLEAWIALGPATSQCELWIAGPAFDGTESRLQCRLTETGIGNVSILGTVPEREKERLLQVADVFVLTSRGEGQSTAILEAMAFRKPILLSRQCYFPEAAANSAGIECDAQVTSIGIALRSFIDMPAETLLEMGERGRKLIEESFSIKHTATALDKAVEQLLIS